MRHPHFNMRYLLAIGFISILCAPAFSRQRGSCIKLLLRDKATGSYILDSVTVTINDSLRIDARPDAAGYYYFALPPTASRPVGRDIKVKSCMASRSEKIKQPI